MVNTILACCPPLGRIVFRYRGTSKQKTLRIPLNPLKNTVERAGRLTSVAHEKLELLQAVLGEAGDAVGAVPD